MCSGAMNWEGVRLSCSLTCSRMYCWQKQQGRSTVSPEHSQPHERMMVDYLQEMSRAGPPDSQDSTLSVAERSCAAAAGWGGRGGGGGDERKSILSFIVGEAFSETAPGNKTSHM